MIEERIFRNEESLTPDAIAADNAAETQLKIPPFVLALTAFANKLNNGTN